MSTVLSDSTQQRFDSVLGRGRGGSGSDGASLPGAVSAIADVLASAPYHAACIAQFVPVIMTYRPGELPGTQNGEYQTLEAACAGGRRHAAYRNQVLALRGLGGGTPTLGFVVEHTTAGTNIFDLWGGLLHFEPRPR